VRTIFLLEYISFIIQNEGFVPVILVVKGEFVKPLSKLSFVFLPLEKLVNGKHFPVNEKHFPVKGKFDLIFRKVFSFYFGRKTLFRSYEKFKNIILFADYVKFGPQIFYCYIFCLIPFSFKFIL